MVLLNDILDHEKAFNDYVHFLSMGDRARATETARTLIDAIRTTLQKIQHDYPTLLIEAHIPSFTDDEKTLRASKEQLALNDLTSLARRLESYISQVGHEAQRLRRREPSRLYALYIRYRKPVLISVGAVAGLAIVAIGVRRWIVSGRGLAGEYYGDMEMGALYRRRIDPMIDFTWGRGSPFKKWNKNRFSVRWNGYLLVPETGRYDIYVHVDDGARLYIDDELIIDEWDSRKIRVIQESMDLKYGYHVIRLDYFDRTKNATIRLFWKRASNPRPEPIPSRFLCPSDSARRRGIPVFGMQLAEDESEKAPESPVDEDEAEEGEPTAPQPPPPASKG